MTEDDRAELQPIFEAMEARFDVLEVAWARSFARNDLDAAEAFERFLLDRAEHLHVTRPDDPGIRLRAGASVRLAEVLAIEVHAARKSRAESR